MTKIDGHCDAKFRTVREAFAENFATLGERRRRGSRSSRTASPSSTSGAGSPTRGTRRRGGAIR